MTKYCLWGKVMNYFGTDGIRGTYGSTLTNRTAFLLGKSLASCGDCPIVVIARDTRTSGEKLFSALAQGVYDGGGNVINLGVLPTNAVAHFVRKFGGDFGVMISASHNPPCDNGLKVFDKYGVKLCTSKQVKLSQIMDEFAHCTYKQTAVAEPVFYDIVNFYTDDIVKLVNVNLQGINVALDCCYGASYRVAPLAFEKSHASKVTAFCTKPSGNKINVNCGATHTDYLLDKMSKGGYQLGFAFDGDADRLAVFEGTQFVPNNKVFYAIAKYLNEGGKLLHNTVCGTTLTNGGVVRSLAQLGIATIRSDVGDVNVFNKMVANNLNFGGEESGHYLLCDFATSADAVINALFVAKIYTEVGSILNYTSDCNDLPYVMNSINLTDETARLATEPNLQATATRVSALYPNCRLVLRKSGTENKLRCYAEGCDCQAVVNEIAATFAQTVID